MSSANLDSPPQRVTMRDVAVEAGVSIATVSRVLNDSASVAPATRAAVMQVVERRSFTARRGGRSRSASLRNVVAVRCPYILDDYFGIVLSAVARSLRQHGKRLVLSAEAEEGDEPSIGELLLPETTEGAILILPPEPREQLTALREQRYPFVVLDPRTSLPGDVAAVSAAHLAGSRAATEHLLMLGHERIGAIAGPENWIASDGRLVGYRAALAAAGRLAPGELVRAGGEPTVESGYEAASWLLDLAVPPTAIVAFNDKMAIGAYQAARKRGLRVPEDLSIVGFDDVELSRVAQPPLTTVRQPLEEMARMAVALLVRLIEGQEIDTLHVELATELIVRDSTAPPTCGGS